VLDAKKATIRSERNSRKEPLSDREARLLLGAVGRVVVSKGKKSSVLDASQAKLADLKGPTGNYRAPMVRKGKMLLVGFNLEALEELL
jgi:hypothetical protein